MASSNTTTTAAALPVNNQSPPAATGRHGAASAAGLTHGAGRKVVANMARAQAQPASGGSNIAAVRQAWLDKCKELGERRGGGAAAELEWMEDMVERAHPPRCEITPDDAQEGYNAWRAGVDAKQGFRAKPQKKSTKDKAVSEAKTMIAWGGLPNASAPRVFGTVQRVVNATPSLRGEMAEHLLKVARNQIKKPDTPFTEAEIKQLLTMEAEKAEKVEVEELAVERKRLQKIGETYTFSPHLRSAINSLSERIEQLGGTKAEKALAEREARKAARAIAKKAAKKASKK
jgi:hypothetical protein